jgi:hypothetical protein
MRGRNEVGTGAEREFREGELVFSGGRDPLLLVERGDGATEQSSQHDGLRRRDLAFAR